MNQFVRNLKRCGSELVAIDLRSLAAFRISIGLIWMCELVVRLAEVTAFYSDQGVLPRDKALLHFPETATYSILMWSGEAWLQSLIFVIALVFACMMTLGIATRAATVVTWFLCISIQSRNEMILYGADHLIRVLLFWAMFLPLGERWAGGRWERLQIFPRHSKSTKISNFSVGPERVASVWSLAILLQVAYFYFFGAVLKTGAEWRIDGTALSMALNYDQLTGDWGRFLLQFPESLKFLTFSTFYLEISSLAFLFFPIFTGNVRFVLVLLLMSFHAGIALTMSLYFIPFVNMTGLLLFLPSGFWNRLDGTFEPSKFRRSTFDNSLTRTVGLFLIAYVLLWNLGTASPQLQNLLKPYRWLGLVTRLDQDWSFYAPRPFDYDGWWVFSGTTFSGNRVDAWAFDVERGPSYERPARIDHLFTNGHLLNSLNAHWMAHSILSLPEFEEPHRRYMLSYLCMRWNARYSGENRLREIEMVYIAEPTRLDAPIVQEPPRYLARQICPSPNI